MKTMTAVVCSKRAEACKSALKTAIAGLLNREPDSISDASSLEELFAGDLSRIRLIWDIIRELQERRLRISGDWTPISLALEWEKTDACQPKP